ncbi:MAG: CBS domain-containing protein, partial [Actinomycetes bacterium]
MTTSVLLSDLLALPLVDTRGDQVGSLVDVIVRIVGDGYPPVTGFAATVAGREVFLPRDQIGTLTGDRIELRSAVLDVRRFTRREGEVLLKADVLKHRMIDVDEARLLQARDVGLAEGADGIWEVRWVDTRRPTRFFGLIGGGGIAVEEDWKDFEPLLGHDSSAGFRGRFGRVSRMKPAQIADLIEEASGQEETELLATVKADPELEADVFEELEPDQLTRLLSARSDEEAADVLSRMRADDAADAIADLPQDRRRPVLDLLPVGQRTKVLTLLGFNPASAGGLMGMDFVEVDKRATVADALAAVRAAVGLQPEALTTIYTKTKKGRLHATVRLSTLVQSEPETVLTELAEVDPVCVEVSTDAVDVALLMSDFNLTAIPVVDADMHVLGIVTFDDILEATIPDDWRRREPASRPDLPDEDEDSAGDSVIDAT